MKPVVWFAAGLVALLLVFGALDGWTPLVTAFTELP
jgi:hypothetical protein